jgi:hypothetical protein
MSRHRSQQSDEYTFDPSTYLGESDYEEKNGSNTQDNTPSRRPSMKRILSVQHRRIELLMQANKEKEERLEKLEKKLNDQQVQKKEGIYWLQLQLDTARREKDAAEERMAELQADLQHIVHMEEKTPTPEESGDAELHQKLQKYETTMGVMENQLTMIKTSSGEVIKTLKEEIADLMDQNSRMEVDLLNQISTLDREKQRAELEFELRLNEKDETIAHLQSQKINDVQVSPSDIKALQEEVKKLRLFKQFAEEAGEKERAESNELIHRLKEGEKKLQRELDAAMEDLKVLRSKGGIREAAKVLDRVAQEREAINSDMDRVGTIWELADASISYLEGTIDQLRPIDAATGKVNQKKMLTTLESASLLHGEIKVSLLLIELKLRNQLQCLKNDKLTLGSEAPSDEEVIKKMEEIQKDALTALQQVETTLTEQMKELEETALKDTAQMKIALQERVKTLEEMKTEYSVLEGEISQLKLSNHDSVGDIGNSSSSGEQAVKGRNDGQVVAVSSPVMNQLHAEIVRIVDRIQEKNATILSLKKELEEHKAREENLRKELKRALRNNNAGGLQTPTKSKTKKIISPEKKQLLLHSGISSPTKSGVKTPLKVKDSLSARYGITQSPASATMPHTPNSSIRPLQPSPREISRPRFSPGSPPLTSQPELTNAAE